MRATRRSSTSSTASPGTSEAVWPSGPRPRWTRSRALRQRGFVLAGAGLEVTLGDRHRPQRRLVLERETEDEVGQVALLAARAPRSARRPGTARSRPTASPRRRRASPASPTGCGRRSSPARRRPAPRPRPARRRRSARRRRCAAALSSATTSSVAASGCLLVVPAELLAHRREHLVAEVVEAARGEALVERRGQDRRRHALVDRRDRGPAALAGVRDPAGEVGRGRAIPASPPRSGRAARSRSRCRGARPRRPRGCRGRTGSTRAARAAPSRRRPRAATLPASALSRMLSPSA